ncbi:MAG TPA: hypothetical protein VIY73_03430 [Polyangiaceae bacterium]
MTYDDAQRWLSHIGGSFRVAPAGDGARTLTVAVEVDGVTLRRSRSFDLQREGIPPDRRRRQAFADACEELRGALEQLEPAGLAQVAQVARASEAAGVAEAAGAAEVAVVAAVGAVPVQDTPGEPTG